MVASMARDAPASSSKALQHSTMNAKLREMKYAVRGEVPIAAERIQNDLLEGKGSYPFKEILYCNIGNPHSVGQKPITWYRQVMALVNCPSLLDEPSVKATFPTDVQERAAEIVAATAGGTGAYSHSKGVPYVRKQVANFCTQRDGHSCDPEHIYLCAGASSGIEKVMAALIDGPNDAIMIPIPQYPLYSALITLYGGKQVGYYLDEESGWGFDLQATKDALVKARADGLNPKAFCVINPGNPTGQVMSYDDLTSIVKFCKEEKLMLLSDEVYQENIYGEGLKFTSMKKIVRDLGADYDDFELASFHSTSKGLIGECGRRGGYMELCGFDAGVEGEIFKLACMGLCPNLDGQIMTGLMINQPKAGEPSYELFNKEQTGVYDSLKRKAKMLVDALNDIDGFSCQTANGAMYAFPSIQLSAAAIAAAGAKGQAPDLFYCLALLEETGICCVPGSGFLQKPGTYHFRTTFLPPEEKLAEALVRFKAFDQRFTAQYA